MSNGKDIESDDSAVPVGDCAAAEADKKTTSTAPTQNQETKKTEGEVAVTENEDVEEVPTIDANKEGKDKTSSTTHCSDSPKKGSSEDQAKVSLESKNGQTKSDEQETKCVNEATTTNTVNDNGDAIKDEGGSTKAEKSEDIEVPMLPGTDDNVTDTTVNALKNQSEEAIIQGALDLGDVKVPGITDGKTTNGEASDLAKMSQGKNGKAFFPMKLYDIVSDEKNEDVIKWLPGGKAFIIVDKKKFANELLPMHFQQSQFTSFTRKLSRWRFTRVPRGPFIGAYYNKLFLKGHRSLCWHMRCKNENIGKMKFERKIDASLASNKANLGANLNPGAVDPLHASRGVMMPPHQQQHHNASMMHGLPGQMQMQGMPGMPGMSGLQGYQMAPMGAPMGAMPGQPFQQMPGQPPNMQGGVSPGLNNQILAIEGKLRELQNARSAEQAAFMYGNPQMMGMPNGMPNMVDYGNAQFMGGAPGVAPGAPMPPQAGIPIPHHHQEQQQQHHQQQHHQEQQQQQPPQQPQQQQVPPGPGGGVGSPPTGIAPDTSGTAGVNS